MDLRLDHEFFFNPDGTGKVDVAWTGPLQSPDVDTTSFLREEVAKAKGVEAWSGLSCQAQGETLVFRGTAYFRNVSELRFHCQGVHVSAVDFATATDENGAFTVVNRVEAKKEAPVAEGDLRQAIAQTREQMAMGRAFIEGMFGGLVCGIVIHLPGPIGTLKNAKKVDPQTASAEVAGKDLVAIFDRLLTDDDLMAEMLRRGGGPDALASLLGDKGPIHLSTKGKAKPQFDYEAEVAAAAAHFEAFRAEMNVPAGPDRLATAQVARLVAVKYVREADGDRELNPMGQNFTGYSFVVAFDLPGPAIKAEEGFLEAFVTDDGQDLCPPEEWDRKCHFPKLTNDGKTALCEFSVKFADGEPAGLRDIRGFVRVHVGTDAEEVDLGFSRIAAGAEGKEFGAQIQNVETRDDGRTSIELRLGIAMERVQALALVDKKGNAVELNRGGYSSSGDECTLNLDTEAELKPGLKLKARVLKDLKQFDVPFAAENVDLLGRPRG